MTDAERAQRLREQAARIREASLSATSGGRLEDRILQKVADKLDADADLLELRSAAEETAQECRLFPPMP